MLQEFDPFNPDPNSESYLPDAESPGRSKPRFRIHGYSMFLLCHYNPMAVIDLQRFETETHKEKWTPSTNGGHSRSWCGTVFGCGPDDGIDGPQRGARLIGGLAHPLLI